MGDFSSVKGGKEFEKSWLIVLLFLNRIYVGVKEVISFFDARKCKLKKRGSAQKTKQLSLFILEREPFVES